MPHPVAQCANWQCTNPAIMPKNGAHHLPYCDNCYMQFRGKAAI